MVVFSCEQNWMAMLSCIYEASKSRLGYKNIMLMVEPIGQYSFLNEYRHVEPDMDKAYAVSDAIKKKISPNVYEHFAYCSMAYEEDILDNIYHVMILGFNFGSEILNMVAYRDVIRNKEIYTRLSKEVCRFREILRFHEIRKELYVAHIEPKSRLVMALGPAFIDRMPSEYWIIVDDVHREAVIHPKNEDFFIKQLNDEEYQYLLLTEKDNDEYTDLWRTFFESIAIKERENARLQRNLFPLWSRKHAVEFI